MWRLHSPRLSLRRKLIGFTLIATTVVILGLGLFFVTREVGLVRKSGTELAEQATDLVALGSAPAVLFGDREALREALASLRAVPDIEQAWVCNEQGRLMARFDRDPRSVSPDSAGTLAIDTTRLLLVERPIEHRGRSIGTIHVAFDMTPVIHRTHQSVTLVGMVALAAMIVSGLVAGGLFQTVAHRLKRLTAGAQRLSEGQYDARISEAGHDEIGQLAEILNAMATSIQAANGELSAANERLQISQAQVQRYAEGLEMMVEDRTRQLRVAKEAAETASMVKSEFLANVSHEIRTPLNGIIGLADLLAVSPVNGEQREWVGNILQCGENLLALINDVLDFSKVESGRLELLAEPFVPQHLAERAIAMVKPRADAQGLALQLEVIGDAALAVVGDERRLFQVLLNLVANAVKFTERGSVRVVLRLMPEEDRRTCRASFDVIDTGIGIAPENLEMIFESFTQVDGSTARRYGGTGLGLAIARRLTQLMGGRLAVQSLPGQGSTFSLEVTLPLADVAAHGAAA